MTDQITEIPEKPARPEIVSEIPQKKNNLFKNVLLVVLGLLVAGGLVYAGMNLGKKQSSPEIVPPVIGITPTSIPSPVIKEVLETMGTITGRLCYPSSFLPPGEIAAKNVSTKEIFKQKYLGSIEGGKNIYSFELAPGNYFVRYEAHASLDKPDIFTSGYYTFCSINLEQCATDQNHETLEVEVKTGETKPGIDLCDFYYGPNNEPLF